MHLYDGPNFFGNIFAAISEMLSCGTWIKGIIIAFPYNIQILKPGMWIRCVAF